MSKNAYPLASINGAHLDTSVSFDPQLPLGASAGTALGADADLLPPGIQILGEGKIRLNMYAPTAVKVEAVIVNTGTNCPLQKGEDGVWSAEAAVPFGGFCPVTFLVDGVDVLNPLAPVGFGGSRPINYMDLPEADDDFYQIKDVPHGAVVQEYYPSKATGCVKSCLVYTPPGYMKDTENQYPVLYLQHGHGENEQCWIHQGRANFILDNLIAEGKISPCIVVMNNGMVQTIQDGVRVLNTGKITDLLLQDCIPYIESHYRVRTDKWSRAMAGLSMGSMQTSYTTLAHPELFGYAGVFSGFVGSIGKIGPASMDYLHELDDAEKFARDFKVFFRAVGDTDFVALDRFHADDAYFAEKGLSPEQAPNHIVRIYTGAHEWNVWRKCLRDFIQMIF